MRTATPLVTCASITDCAPRATRGSISTPSFIGPGCITSAPGLARASRSSVSAYVLTYSRKLGNSPPVWRSSCMRSSITTSAPSRASSSRYVRSTFHGRPSQKDATGSSVGGPHSTTSAPISVRPHRFERATRLCRMSPTMATRRPLMRPSRSRMVNRSSSACVGWACQPSPALITEAETSPATT